MKTSSPADIRLNLLSPQPSVFREEEEEEEEEKKKKKKKKKKSKRKKKKGINK